MGESVATPVPQADSEEELNKQLAMAYQREFTPTGGGRDRATTELLAADRTAFLPLLAKPFETVRVEPVVINSLSLGRFDGNDYSIPTAFAYPSLAAIGTIDRVRSPRRSTVVAEHAHCWGKGQGIFEPLH